MIIQNGTKALQNLPSELIQEIFSYIHGTQLLTCRLICSSVELCISERVFKTVTLSVDSTCAEWFTCIARSKRTGPQVRKVRLRAQLGDYDLIQDGSHLEDFINAIPNIAKLQGLRELQIAFDEDCAAPSEEHVVNSDVEYRWILLQRIFSTVHSLNKESPERVLSSLVIENLQSYNDPRLIQKSSFYKTVKGLSTLDLDIVSPNEGVLSQLPGNPELHSFYWELGSIWLEPNVKTLTVMSLCSDIYWGWYPRVDFRGLCFPRLKILALGNFIFSHQWQVEWISSHGASLEELSLLNCRILENVAVRGGLTVDGDENTQGYPLFPLRQTREREQPKGDENYTFSLVWADIFQEWLRSLSRLHTFRFGEALEPLDELRPYGAGKRTRYRECDPKYIKFESPTLSRWNMWKPSDFHAKHTEQGFKDIQCATQLLKDIDERQKP